MTTAHAVSASQADPELPATSRDSLVNPNETTPLLRTNRSHVLRWTHSEWWSPAKAAVSACLDRNTGLLLVAVSQFFFAATNISVKWLNNLDEPIPTLEVCIGPKSSCSLS
jgi:hypothetical protein